MSEGDGTKKIKRVLSMRNESKESGRVRMNPHYKREIPVSLIENESGDGGKSVLRQAIRKNDLSYVSEFLVNKNRSHMLKTLSCNDKEMLGEILLEFVDQPLRVEALEVLREIISNIRDVECFINRLKTRMIDFSKLVYVKGKIDYLRFTLNDLKEDEPEVIING